MKIKSLLLILTIIVFGCRHEFLFETSKYNQTMVVEGLISNEEGPYTIKLSLSAPINDVKKIPYENCIVIINEKTDSALVNISNSEELTEVDPGVYVTSEGGIQGVVGNYYSVTILTPEGKEFNSEYQKIIEPIEIDKIYTELKYIEDEDYPSILPGYQFFIDTKDAPNKDRYILWNLNETFEYTADYELYAIYSKGNILIDGIDTLTNYKSLQKCWKTQKVNYIFTGKTLNLSLNKITHQPLHFVNTTTKKLSERYSLLVRQYTISEKAYYYWKGLEDQSLNDNVLEATQPYNANGNIRNVNNNSEIIFGFFTVAAVDKQRLFVETPSVPFYYTKCYIALDLDEIFKHRPKPIFLIEIEENGHMGAVFENCIDCQSEGGINVKPEFWIDK